MRGSVIDSIYRQHDNNNNNIAHGRVLSNMMMLDSNSNINIARNTEESNECAVMRGFSRPSTPRPSSPAGPPAARRGPAGRPETAPGPAGSPGPGRSLPGSGARTPGPAAGPPRTARRSSSQI